MGPFQKLFFVFVGINKYVEGGPHQEKGPILNDGVMCSRVSRRFSDTMIGGVFFIPCSDFSCLWTLGLA